MKISLILLTSLSMFLNGCATILKSSTEKVTFSSNPSGAKVYVNGSMMGVTPFETKLSAKKQYQIEFKKEGYESKSLLLANKVGAGWLILDIILFIFPVIVDAATGDWQTLDENVLNVHLEKGQ